LPFFAKKKIIDNENPFLEVVENLKRYSI